MTVTYYIEFNDPISEIDGLRVSCVITDQPGGKINLADNTVVRATAETGKHIKTFRDFILISKQMQ